MFHFLNHSKRVAELACDFSIHFDVDVVNLKNAALLHDIGKIYIPDNIINKPSKLTSDEMVIMKSHVVSGVEHIRKGLALPFLISADSVNDIMIRIIMEHHENYDGSGYFGKKGNDILVESRILRISDCYDALLSKRVYKAAFTSKEALVLMEKEKDNFDPGLLNSFRNFIEFKERAQICALIEAGKQDECKTEERAQICAR